MNPAPLKIVLFGLSMRSMQAASHAVGYRSLVRELSRRGHDVLFLERYNPSHLRCIDLPHPPYGRNEVYVNAEHLREQYTSDLHDADLVIVGSDALECETLGAWVLSEARGLVAYYDLSAQDTLEPVAGQIPAKQSRELIGRYHLYLSTSGGPALRRLERDFGARCARAFHVAIDPTSLYPVAHEKRWDLGFLDGAWLAADSCFGELLLAPAITLPQQRFIVAMPGVARRHMPYNVDQVEHLAESELCAFYNSQRFSLDLAGARRAVLGYSPQASLLQAAACGTPVITGGWPGLEEFFKPEEEVLVAHDAADVVHYLTELSEEVCQVIGARARRRVLEAHTAAHRAAELEELVFDLLAEPPARLLR